MSDDFGTTVIVGGSGSGKTSLFNAMYRNYYRRESFVQGGDFTAKVNINGRPGCMTVFDTSSLEALFDLRRIIYLSANVIILTFALNDRESFREVETKWYPEVKYFGPDGASYILVGNKKDLREEDESNEAFVRHEEGLLLAKRLNLPVYLECSATTGESVVTVFKSAAQAAFKPQHPTRKCEIL